MNVRHFIFNLQYMLYKCYSVHATVMLNVEYSTYKITNINLYFSICFAHGCTSIDSIIVGQST